MHLNERSGQRKRGRGKAKFPSPVEGKRFTVYLHGYAIDLLDYEISMRSKPVKGFMDRERPKGLTYGKLAQACVYYVIKKKKLKDILPSFKRYPF